MAFDILGPTTRVLAVGLDAVHLRQQVVSNNIANVDTPGFKASWVDFETSLRTAMEDGRFDDNIGATSTQRSLPDLGIASHLVMTPAGINGNNVDLRHEVMSAMQSQFQYQTLTRAVSDQASIMRTSIGGQA